MGSLDDANAKLIRRIVQSDKHWNDSVSARGAFYLLVAIALQLTASETKNPHMQTHLLPVLEEVRSHGQLSLSADEYSQLDLMLMHFRQMCEKVWWDIDPSVSPSSV